MKKPVLVVMAAGMGSRYGGLKQIGVTEIDIKVYPEIVAKLKVIIKAE